jgi:hypothetical protein
MAYWGIFNDATALPNVGTDVGGNLSVGDTAFVGTVSYVCVGAAAYPLATWVPDVTVQSGGLTRSYGDGTVVFNGSATPATNATVAETMSRSGGNVDLTTLFDTVYFRCRVHLRVVDAGTSTVILETTTSFASLADLVTWLNTNVPSSSGLFIAMCMIRVFDIIDGSIEMPSKVYGKNRFWAGLTNKASGGYYWSPRAYSCRYADSQPTAVRTVFGSALESMWTNIHGAGTINSSATWTGAEFACFWISRNRRRRFDMPAFSATALSVTSAPAGERMVQVPGPLTQNPGVPPWSFSGTIWYAAIDSTATGFTTFSRQESFSTLARLILSGWSVVVGYGLVSGAGELAVLVRPVGIDQLWFDWYDTAAYQLEAVGRTRRDIHPRIRIIQPPQFFALHRSAGPVDVTQFRESFGATARDDVTGVIGRHGYTTGEVRFQLRRLSDNYVSPLTTARVSPTIRKRARPWALGVVDGVSV